MWADVFYLLDLGARSDTDAGDLECATFATHARASMVVANKAGVRAVRSVSTWFAACSILSKLPQTALAEGYRQILLVTVRLLRKKLLHQHKAMPSRWAGRQTPREFASKGRHENVAAFFSSRKNFPSFMLGCGG